MGLLRTTTDDEATELTARLYESERKDLGYVPDYTRVMAVNPEALDAFQALVRAIVHGLGKRRFELVTLAAARAIGSQHCLLAHGRKSIGLFPDEQLVRIARDYHSAGLPEAEVVMMEFAEKISGDAAAMTEADARKLREHGFSDRDIVDITLAASVRNYYSRSLLALGAEVQVPPGLSPELQDALLAT
jgi:uncharacterized peroxidase-related enzyme